MSLRMSALLRRGLQSFSTVSSSSVFSNAQGGANMIGRQALQVQKRCLSVTAPLGLKEITMKEEGDKLVIEGKHVPSPRQKYLAPLTTSNHKGECKECPLCKLGLQVGHTDVLIIGQFIDSKGKQLPRDVTGLCRHQHRRMEYLIVMAEKAGLIEREVERVVTHNGVILYKPEEWEDPHFHKYYDENVIEEFLYTRRKRH